MIVIRFFGVYYMQKSFRMYSKFFEIAGKMEKNILLIHT